MRLQWPSDGPGALLDVVVQLSDEPLGDWDRPQASGGLRALNDNLTLHLLTLTIPHAAGETLAALLAVVNGSQRRLWAGRWGQRFRARWGMAGQVRAIEMTSGARRGWGPHVHAVLVLERAALDNAEWVEMWGQLYQRWQSVVVAAGGRLPNAYGVDLALVNDPRQVAEYVTDAGGWSIGSEVGQGPVKMGRSSGRWAPFALLAAAAMWGDRDAADLWTEYETATAGKHAIVASAGLYEVYGVGVADDEEASRGGSAIGPGRCRGRSDHVDDPRRR